jgi:putative glycosyltransferase (TIGR04372 family)
MGWRIFSRTSTLLLLPVSGVVWLVRLMGHYPKFQIADRVVLMTRPSGFSYSIHGPDVARRMAPGKRVLFLIASWRYDFNPEVLKLWSDIKDIEVVFVPRFVFARQLSKKGLVILPFLKPHDSMMQWLTRWFVRLVGKGRVRFQSLIELYDEMITADADLVSSPDRKLWTGDCTIFTSYVDLQKHRPAPPLRLPVEIRNDFKRKFHEAWHTSGYKERPKPCCLYLRYEKPHRRISRLKNGGELSSVLPAIRLLNAAGYQVALTGDREMTPEIRREFGGRLIDDVTINSDRNIYQLYAASEADFFIGNNGGGVTLPTTNEIPCLFLDWHPVIDGFSRSWLYFKSAIYKDGSPVPYDRFLEEHALDFSCSFGTLSHMTEEEITEAVEFFLQDLKKMDAPDPHADVAALIPHGSFRRSGARISPAWVHRNVPEQGAPLRAGK